MNPAQGMLGGVLHSRCRAVEDAGKAEHPVMRGATATRTNRYGGGKSAGALWLGQRGNKVLAYRYVVVNGHNSLAAGHPDRLLSLKISHEQSGNIQTGFYRFSPAHPFTRLAG
jgi:hypothetical protein